jgi:hypothetical protein
MKKFWLIFLSLGLVMAFSVSAFAVDVKVSGEFYVAGMYLNKTSVHDAYTISGVNSTNVPEGPSTAFFYQRLRIGTDFIVSPCLKLVTRFDALERVWGGARSAPASGTLSPVSGSGYYSPLAIDSAGTTAENENIAFDLAYIDYVSPIGTFDVGYMIVSTTGTVFNNNSTPGGRLKYTSNPLGAFTISADITKIADNSYSAVNSSSYFANVTNSDNTQYGLTGEYKWNDGRTGMKITYYDYASTEPQGTIAPPALTSSSYNYAGKYTLFNPYAIAKIGPVDLQAEANYLVGKYKAYDSGISGKDVSISNLSAFLDATVTFAPIYVGGTFAYVSGDDPSTTDQQEGGTLTGGWDWNPCLLLFSTYDVTKWVGPVYGYNAIAPTAPGKPGTSMVDGPMTNAWFLQGRVGVKPTPQFDAVLSASYAFADKKPSGFTGGTYGTEIDLTGTYKITNNLSYMLGFGYLFTGDYFKGKDNGTHTVDNDYILMNKITLSF